MVHTLRVQDPELSVGDGISRVQTLPGNHSQLFQITLDFELQLVSRLSYEVRALAMVMTYPTLQHV